MTDKLPRHPGMRAFLLVPIVIFAVASACDVTAPSSPQTDIPAEQSNQPEAGIEPQVAEGSQEPLVSVDGVITTIGVEGLSPGDIKRIEVIKGAAAASLYGDRGGHGVIHVFTKGASSEVERIQLAPEESAYDAVRLIPEDVPLPPSESGLSVEGIRLRVSQPDP